jgi:hypothetical protein
MFTNKDARNLHLDAAVVAGILVVSTIAPAYAYVDPGSISIVVTAILGSIAAVGYSARMYWGRFLNLFSRNKNPK